jgi:hypothetical protein
MLKQRMLTTIAPSVRRPSGDVRGHIALYIFQRLVNAPVKHRVFSYR